MIEENEFGVIENPYYGDAEVIELNPTQKSPTAVDLNNVQFLTATQNLYYEMWHILIKHTYCFCDELYV